MTEDTLPPVPPRKWERLLLWAKLHPEVTVPAGTFLLGVFVGWVLG